MGAPPGRRLGAIGDRRQAGGGPLLPMAGKEGACSGGDRPAGIVRQALRHYDTSGVLTPALVDPDSGYRYYRRDQLDSARLVRALRQLDVPIDEVRDLMASHAAGRDIAGPVLARLAAAELRLEVQRALVRNLLHRHTEGDELTSSPS
ncbi:hypothetical protein GCM10010441_04720 [Kitasatospora paracochleata]